MCISILDKTQNLPLYNQNRSCSKINENIYFDFMSSKIKSVPKSPKLDLGFTPILTDQKSTNIDSD